METLFGDSYAFIEAMDGSATYIKLLRDNKIITSQLNLVEVARAVLLRRGEAEIDATLRPLAHLCIELEPRASASVAREAAVFRQERLAARVKCSTVDAWGYAVARHLEVPFLTGDQDFRGVPGVKFVKA